MKRREGKKQGKLRKTVPKTCWSCTKVVLTPPPDSAQGDLHPETHSHLLPWVLEIMYLTLVLPPPPDPAQKGLHQEEHPPLLPWVLEVGT